MVRVDALVPFPRTPLLSHHLSSGLWSIDCLACFPGRRQLRFLVRDCRLCHPCHGLDPLLERETMHVGEGGPLGTNSPGFRVSPKGTYLHVPPGLCTWQYQQSWTLLVGGPLVRGSSTKHARGLLTARSRRLSRLGVIAGICAGVPCRSLAG